MCTSNTDSCFANRFANCAGGGKDSCFFSLCCCLVAQLYRALCNPMDCAHQASLPFTIIRSLLKPMSIESMTSSNCLILCHLLLLPSVFPSVGVFFNELTLCIRWPKCWSFSISPSSEYSGLISLRIDWFDLLAIQGTLKSLLQNHSSVVSTSGRSAGFLMVWLSHLYMTTETFLASVDFLRDAHFEPLGYIFSLPSYTDWWGFCISPNLGRGLRVWAQGLLWQSSSCDSELPESSRLPKSPSTGHGFPGQGTDLTCCKKKKKERKKPGMGSEWSERKVQVGGYTQSPPPEAMLILGIPVNRLTVHTSACAPYMAFSEDADSPILISSHYTLLLLVHLSVLHGSKSFYSQQNVGMLKVRTTPSAFFPPSTQCLAEY